MREPRFIAVVVLTLVLGYVGVSVSQSAHDSSKPAANAWMLTPTPYLEWNKDILASLRAQRDRFWDQSAPQRTPLSAPGAEEMSTPAGQDVAGNEPEIRNLPNRVILAGTFTKHRSVLSASEYSLYTEITLHVDAVFDDRSGSGQLFVGKDVTLLISGGTVALESGRILTHNTSPRELFLQPGHRYLLVLRYHGDGDFYQYTDDWDIEGGTVRANSPRVRYLAQTGHSSLDGLATQQLGPALEKILYGHQ